LACAAQALLEKGEGVYDGGVQGKFDAADHAEDRRGGLRGQGCSQRLHAGRLGTGGKLLAFGSETCSIFPAANLAARRVF
jgi:hypothetical protein